MRATCGRGHRTGLKIRRLFEGKGLREWEARGLGFFSEVFLLYIFFLSVGGEPWVFYEDQARECLSDISAWKKIGSMHLATKCCVGDTKYCHLVELWGQFRWRNLGGMSGLLGRAGAQTGGGTGREMWSFVLCIFEKQG